MPNQNVPLYKSSLFRCRGASLFCITAVLASAAGAHANNTNTNTEVEEIRVTANKREQRLLDVAGSISVVRPDALQHASLADIARGIPGFSMIDAGPRNPVSLIIRGLRMDQIDVNDLGGDGGTVASYVDNIPLQGSFVPPAFSLKDVQQVEVLRGPQGTLYGNASVGGLIRYVTAKPDLTDTSVSITAAISQTDHSSGLNYDTDLVVNAPLIDNTLGVRLLLGKQDNQGFIDNPYLLGGAQKDINDDETRVARLSVLWQPTTEFSLAGSHHVQKVEVNDRQASNPEFTDDDYTASSRYLQPMNGDLQLSALDASYQFSWARLTGSVNRYDYTSARFADQTDYLLTLDEIYAMGFYSASEDFSAFTSSDVEVLKHSVEVRLVSDSDQRMRWLLGAFYSTDELEALVFDIAPGFSDFIGLNRSDDIDYVGSQMQELKEHSIYGEIAYDIIPQWEILFGARQFHYRDDVTSCFGYPIGYGLEGDELDLECWGGKDKQNDVLGKFSTKYQLNQNQNIYFTIAEGFRRGGANFLPSDVENNRSYQPDTATNYELGHHGYFLQQQLRVSAALFYTDWEDIQIPTVVDGAYNAWGNAKGARSEGIELEARAKLSHGWSITTGVTVTDAELTEDVPNLNGGDENAYAGNTLPGSARYQWHLGVDYTRTFSQAILDVGANISHLSEIYTALNSEFADYDRLAGYSIANVHARVTWRNWQVGAFIHNIANTRGVTSTRTSGWYGEQGQFENITRPRTLGVSVNYTY